MRVSFTESIFRLEEALENLQVHLPLQGHTLYSTILYPFRVLLVKLVSKDLQRVCDKHRSYACGPGELLTTLHSAKDYTG